MINKVRFYYIEPCDTRPFYIKAVIHENNGLGHFIEAVHELYIANDRNVQWK